MVLGAQQAGQCGVPRFLRSPQRVDASQSRCDMRQIALKSMADVDASRSSSGLAVRVCRSVRSFGGCRSGAKAEHPVSCSPTTLSYECVGAAGILDIDTPHLDTLAAGGTSFHPLVQHGGRGRERSVSPAAPCSIPGARSGTPRRRISRDLWRRKADVVAAHESRRLPDLDDGANGMSASTPERFST